MIKGVEPLEAYICDEGLGRFCTENYQMPYAGNMKNMYMHLTNYSLNKNSENYIACDGDNFLKEDGDKASKRLLSTIWKTLDEEGYDTEKIYSEVKDTIKKCIKTLEPYLKNYYQINLSRSIENSKVFQVVGLDVLIDRKNKPWIMEINANPSLNIFLEREIPGGMQGQTEKVLQELDKHVKTKVVNETIRLVTGEGNGDDEGCFEQILPDPSMDDTYNIWN